MTHRTLNYSSPVNASLPYHRDASLLSFLPKTLGFAVGLEFRDNTLLLNSSNSTQFTDGKYSLLERYGHRRLLDVPEITLTSALNHFFLSYPTPTFIQVCSSPSLLVCITSPSPLRTKLKPPRHTRSDSDLYLSILICLTQHRSIFLNTIFHICHS